MVNFNHVALWASLATAAPLTKRSSEPKYAIVRINSDGPTDLVSGLPQPNVEFMLIGSSVFGLLGQLIGGLAGAFMPKNTTFTMDSIIAGMATEFNAVQAGIASLTAPGATSGGLQLSGPAPGLSPGAGSMPGMNHGAPPPYANASSSAVSSSAATAAATKPPTVLPTSAALPVPVPVPHSAPAPIPTLHLTPKPAFEPIPSVPIAPKPALPTVPLASPKPAIPSVPLAASPAAPAIPAAASPVMPKPAASPSPAGPTNFMQHPGHGM